ncbi:MAG: TonB-dependent receptor plug domain-containing protein [Candidatus Marinimicrobia bacterium]|nr:TonB-dependent receptor plug domain-containing protein [Candidatus Neomarinimicrobiota bacterium]
MKKTLLALVVLLTFCVSSAFAQSGKISGTVTDAETGEPLPGVNVILVDTELGAATGPQGEYTILNVDPGEYSLRAQIIGYAAITKTGVNVNIGLTRTVDFEMQVEAIAGQEVVVEASQPVVQRDVSGSERNIDIREIESSAHQDVSSLLSTTAGVDISNAYDDSPEFRGEGMGNINFIVDGVSTKDPLSNRPNMRLNMDAIQEVKVQTGGFSARYGNLQSGLVNVVTKEGGNRYSGSIDYRYSPPGMKHFGPEVYAWDSPIVQPFVNPDAGAFTGNDFFEGWDAVAAADPFFDDPMEVYARYLWRHRGADQVAELKRLKDEGIVDIEWGPEGEPEPFHVYGRDVPDQNINATLGGPVPFLPNVKFFTSYSQEFLEYAGQLGQLDGYTTNRFRAKLTSNVTDNIKVMGSYYQNYEKGGTGGQGPGISGFISRDVYDQWGGDNKMWYPHCAVPGEQIRQVFTGKMTHTLSSKTFYDLQLTHTRNDYNMLLDIREAPMVPGSAWNDATSSTTNVPYQDHGMIGTNAWADSVAANTDFPGYDDWFNNWAKVSIDGYWFDEGPKGYGRTNWRDITGEYRMESCNIRVNDTYVHSWDLAGNMTSQVNQNNQLSFGFSVAQYEFKQYYAQIDPSVDGGSIRETPVVNPLQGAFYIEDKMEYGGFVANIGLRGDWLIHDEYPLFNNEVGDKLNGPYTTVIESGRARSIDSLWAVEGLEFERAKHLRLSPRLGISHPIATTAKVYFNYGHAYQWPDLMQSYRAQIETRRGNRIRNIGNPAVAPPRTIMYELGYEHNLFNRMSLSVVGYFKDINARIGETQYNYINGERHDSFTNRQFRDIRGAEFRIELRRGAIPFFAGWASADYRVESNGEYGTDDFYEDPTRPPELENREVSQSDVRPIFKFNFNFNTPQQFGPNLGGFFFPLGGLNLDLLYRWERGPRFTWNPEDYPLVENNVRWKPYQRWDLRFRKPLFTRNNINATFYIDVFNVFNNKNMTPRYGPSGSRATNFAWDTHKWWRNEFEDYMRSLDLEVQQDGSIKGDDVPGDYRTKDKDYIDMPAFTPWTFLEKRDIYFGIDFTF